jgi:magnesium transporter
MVMLKLIKNRSKKIGTPPGTLVHIGEKTSEKVKITIIDYDEKNFEERHVDRFEECLLFREKPSVTWINIDGLHDIDLLDRLGECYGLHHLMLEDILNTDQRPKMDDFGSILYIVLKMLMFRDETGDLEVEQVSLILGDNFVISFQERAGDVFDPVRERIRKNKGRIRKMGADYLAYTLLDIIVDNYFTVLDQLGEDIESLEEELGDSPDPKELHMMHSLRRSVIFIRRSILPLRDIISRLEKGESPLIGESIRIYMKDILDHLMHVNDTIDTSRDMLSSMHDIYLTSMSNRMNEVMKVLTIIATIFIPLSFIAGVYGMNFEVMPELNWRWGYFMCLSLMFIVGMVLVIYFKRKNFIKDAVTPRHPYEIALTPFERGRQEIAL